MTKPMLKLCVLAVSLLSTLALSAQSTSAAVPRDGWSFDLVGIRFCVGGEQRPDCDAYVPLPGSEKVASSEQVTHTAMAPTAAPDSAAPSWKVLPLFGFNLCIGDVPTPVLCDFDFRPAPGTLGMAGMRGIEDALHGT